MYILILPFTDGDKYSINGVEYTFFDIHAKGTKQYGFEFILNNKRLVFLGDEPCNSMLYSKIANADYVMHEAFCLDSEEGIFHAYEKNHSTTKSVSEISQQPCTESTGFEERLKAF